MAVPLFYECEAFALFSALFIRYRLQHVLWKICGKTSQRSISDLFFGISDLLLHSSLNFDNFISECGGIDCLLRYYPYDDCTRTHLLYLNYNISPFFYTDVMCCSDCPLWEYKIFVFQNKVRWSDAKGCARSWGFYLKAVFLVALNSHYKKVFWSSSFERYRDKQRKANLSQKLRCTFFNDCYCFGLKKQKRRKR